MSPHTPKGVDWRPEKAGMTIYTHTYLRGKNLNFILVPPETIGINSTGQLVLSDVFSRQGFQGQVE